jgi:Resolvase, N terminal domain
LSCFTRAGDRPRNSASRRAEGHAIGRLPSSQSGLDARFAQNGTLSRKSLGIRAQVIAPDSKCWEISFQNPLLEPLLKAIIERTPRYRAILNKSSGDPIYGYARVSSDGQSVAAQVAALRKHGAGKVFREVASGAKTERAQLCRLLDQLDAGDVAAGNAARPADAIGDPLNTLAAIADRKAGFRSLGDARADTTTPHGRLMLTVLGGLAEFERELIRTRTS